MASSHEVPTITPKLPEGIEDIDAGDEKKPLCMSIYTKDIYRHLSELEVQYPIEENFLSKQVDITAIMRATVIDWLVDVHVQLSLRTDTFQLAVGIIDRYLQAVPDLNRNQLQLVGVTALFIATKYEELRRFSVCNMVFITNQLCSKNAIFRCEREIVSKLGFSFGKPIPVSFLKRFLKAAHGSTKVYHLALYLVDLCLVEHTMAHYRPSELAAAAICLSLSLLSNKAFKHVWSPTMAYYSGYSLEHLLPIVKKIVRLVDEVRTSTFTAVYRKYSNIRLEKVAPLATTAAMHAHQYE